MAGMIEDDGHGHAGPAPPEALLGAMVPGYMVMLLLLQTGMMGIFVVARHLPLLRVLGGDAPADVLPHRHLGRPAQGVRGDQVLPLHAGRLGAYAAGVHRALLQRRPDAPRRRHAGHAHLRPLELAARATAVAQGLDDPRLRASRRSSGSALFIGFAIKIPMFPFHTWLPDAHVEAPTRDPRHPRRRAAQDGHLRHPAHQLRHPARGDAVGRRRRWPSSASSTSSTARSAPWRRRTSRSSSPTRRVSHMGFCLLGMAALTPTGHPGARRADVQPRHHHRDALPPGRRDLRPRPHTARSTGFGGLATEMPLYTAFVGFAFMASLGLPGLSGFIGEVHGLHRARSRSTVTAPSSRRPASSSPPPTTCGRSSACSSASSNDGATRGYPGPQLARAHDALPARRPSCSSSASTRRPLLELDQHRPSHALVDERPGCRRPARSARWNRSTARSRTTCAQPGCFAPELVLTFGAILLLFVRRSRLAKPRRARSPAPHRGRARPCWRAAALSSSTATRRRRSLFDGLLAQRSLRRLLQVALPRGRRASSSLIAAQRRATSAASATESASSTRCS